MATVVKLGDALLLLSLTVIPAAAQTDNHFALGANLTHRAARDPAGHGSTDLGLAWRFGHGETGWGWTFGLNWYSTDVNRSIGGHDVEFGELHVRPVLAGYGYTRVYGRTSVSADLLGGYAFTTFSMTPVADDAYHDFLGARSVKSDAANTFVLKPEISGWYDLNRKVGINASIGYMIARPRIEVSSSLGEDVQRYRADMLQFRIGAVYSIF